MGFTRVGHAGTEKGAPRKYLGLDAYFRHIVKGYLYLGHLSSYKLKGKRKYATA
jgi:hypothetical protein